jgi:O-antigen ligase
MFKDSPLGTGARSAEIRARRYLPKEALNENGIRSPHNTMMAVLVDHGAPAALIIIGLYAWAAFQLLKMRRLDRQGLPAFFGLFRAAIAGSLAAYIVCGIFINMFRAEVAIWMLALLTVVLPLAKAAVSNIKKQEAGQLAPTLPATIRRPVPVRLR